MFKKKTDPGQISVDSVESVLYLQYHELNKYNQCPGMFLVIVPLTMNGQKCTLYVLKCFLLMKGTSDVGSKL